MKAFLLRAFLVSTITIMNFCFGGRGLDGHEIHLQLLATSINYLLKYDSVCGRLPLNSEMVRLIFGQF